LPVKVPFSKASADTTFEALPDGNYPATISDVIESDGPGPSGFPYLRIQWTLDEGGSEGSKGRKVSRIYSFSPGALWALKQLLVQHKVATSEEVAKNFDLDTRTLVGKKNVLKLGPPSDSSTTFNEVQQVLDADAPVGESAAPGRGW